MLEPANPARQQRLGLKIESDFARTSVEQRGIAGVCIEDKQFPKTNSFLNGERQPLADIEEFVGKIAAGKDTQMDADFCVAALEEALNHSKPEIFNTDQGSQFTSREFTGVLQQNQVKRVGLLARPAS